MREVWRKIPGFEDCYEASNRGRVRRTAYPKKSRWKLGHIINADTNSVGIRTIRLSNGAKKMNIKLKCIIAMTFIGPQRPGYFVEHKNSIRTDNRASNLEYKFIDVDSKEEVIAHRVGTFTKVDKNTEKKIRQLWAQGYRNIYGLAKEFDLSTAQVSKIVSTTTK